jgi:hypothetical protein
MPVDVVKRIRKQEKGGRQSMNGITTTLGMEKCLVCGADIRPIDKFCWNCGSPLRSATSSPQEAQPSMWNPARFIEYTNTGEVVKEYVLDKPETAIGRAITSDIALLMDKLTSRRHATVRYESGHYVLRDEHSANGTFVNGQQLQEMIPYVLQDGDRVTVGEHMLVFRQQG